MVTHVLFDFFGTLVSYSPSRTEQGYERSFDLLKSAGGPLDYGGFLALWSEVSAEFDDIAERSGREFSMIELGRAFLVRAIDDGMPSEVFVRDFVGTYLSEWNKGVRYIEGLPEMLGRLASRFTLAIITNTHDPDLVPNHLERMDVSGFFGRVTTSVEFGVRKPAPDIFEEALRVLDAQAKRCVYVGDSYAADYLGARSAGIRCLLVDPHSQAAIGPSDRLESIADLENHRALR